MKIQSVLTHILSAYNTDCSETETPNLFRSLWPASSVGHWGDQNQYIRSQAQFEQVFLYCGIKLLLM